jgi:hypothetical protein
VTAAEELRRLADEGRLDLARPGTGSTPARHRALLDLARVHPVATARLAEAHTDAIAILAEAGEAPAGRALYGVWASAGPGGEVTLAPDGTISGAKPFCSGVGVVDRALVTVADGDGRGWLVEVEAGDLRPGAGRSATGDMTGWDSPALAEASTGTVTFDHHPVLATLGPPGWYLDRPGFWHGACGPAACWAGAALGLVDHAEAHTDTDPHRLAHLGALRALAWGLRGLLDEAGRQIDADPTDVAAAHARAQSLRYLVERACTEILDRVGQSLGPRAFTAADGIAARFADTHLYLRQHHAQRDLQDLGRLGRHG